MIDRRSLLQGLFIAALNPVTPVFAAVDKNNLVPATVEIFVWRPFTNEISLIHLNDKTDIVLPGARKTRILRDFVEDGLEWMNSTAPYERSDDLYRIHCVEYFISQLQPKQEQRSIYKYSITSDDRNHTTEDTEADAKFVDIKIQPVIPTDVMYSMRFGYDPRLV